jgi:hypothetical protein
VHINFKEKESMSKITTKLSSHKKLLSAKLVMGIMVASISVLVGTASVAGAMPGHSNSGNGYGGSNINIGIGSMGNGNIITIIINYFTGH